MERLDSKPVYADTGKLMSLHELAVKSPDVRSFFTYLYKYASLVIEDTALYASATQMGLADYLGEHSELAQSVDVNDEGSLKELLLSMYRDVSKDYKGQTKPFYCWLMIQAFHAMYSIHPERYKEVDSVLQEKGIPALQDSIKDILGSHYNDLTISADDISNTSEFAEKVRLETTNIFRLNDTTRNELLSRDTFQLYLDVFHTDFTDWLNNHPATQDTLHDDAVVEVSLSFPDIYPVVTNHDTGEAYKFARVVKTSRPFRIIDWCLNHRNGDFATSRMIQKDVKLGKDGLVEDLRKSVFHPNEGVLGVFIVKANPHELIVKNTVKLSLASIEKLKHEAVEVIPKSEN